MTADATVPIVTASRWTRACIKCGRPITLGKHAQTGKVLAFESDPRVVSTTLERGGLVSQWALADRHYCGQRSLLAEPVA